MKKLALVALVVLTTTILGLPNTPALAGEESGEDSAKACTAPDHVWGYGPDAMTYRAEIDLSGCDWWDGSRIRLDVTLARLDAEGETVATVLTLCGLSPGRTERTDRTRYATCEVGVDLDHPAIEVARYRGEVTYPWQDGEATIGFTAFCIAPALQCHDA